MGHKESGEVITRLVWLVFKFHRMFLGDGFYRDQAYLTLEDYINEQPPFTFDMPHNPAGLTLGTFREQSAVKTPAEN